MMEGTRCISRWELYRWVDGELTEERRVQVGRHLKDCLRCQQEVASLQRLQQSLRAVLPSTQPSTDFEEVFWRRVAVKERQAKRVRAFKRLRPFILMPSFREALATVATALLIGVVSGMTSTLAAPDLRAEQTAVRYLSGFREFKGVPSTSLSASYLQVIDHKEPR